MKGVRRVPNIKRLQADRTRCRCTNGAGHQCAEYERMGESRVMIRENLDADSPHAMVVITPGRGAAFQHRPTKGATSNDMPFTRPVATPFWVRVTRTPQDASFVFRGFVSPDGNNWEQVGTEVHISMGAHALAGMAVTAHTDPPNDHLQDLCVSVIDRVGFS